MVNIDPEIRELKQIKRELEEIKDRTANPKRMFVNGILYGAGAFLGGIIAVALIGWLLSFLGVIPGLDVIAEYLQTLLSMES
jgi:hypothetical protein